MSSNKPGKYFTIMVVPHSEKPSYSLRIPLWFCQAAAVGLVLFFVGIFALAHQYQELRSVAKENSYLQEINRAQEENMKEVSRETEMIFNEMDKIEGMSEEVAELLDLEPPQNNE